MVQKDPGKSLLHPLSLPYCSTSMTKQNMLSLSFSLKQINAPLGHSATIWRATLVDPLQGRMHVLAVQVRTKQTWAMWSRPPLSRP